MRFAPLVLFLLAACGRDVAPTPTGPKLKVAPATLAFGTKFDDETADVVATLSNVGDATLHVDRVEPSCGCILLAEAPKEIAPGASFDLAMQVRLVGLEGPFARNVCVYSDDPASIARIPIEGEAKPRIVVEPPAVVVRPATLDATTSVDLVVRSGTDESIGGVVVSSFAPGVTMQTVKNEAVVSVHVVVAPFTEDVHGSIVLRLGKSERVVPVTGIAARDVRVAPEKLWIGSEDRGKAVLASLIPREGLGNWRVVSLETSRKDLLVEMKTADTFAVRIADDAPKGRFEGTVTVVLEGAKPDRLRVLVTGWVSD